MLVVLVIALAVALYQTRWQLTALRRRVEGLERRADGSADRSRPPVVQRSEPVSTQETHPAPTPPPLPDPTPALPDIAPTRVPEAVAAPSPPPAPRPATRPTPARIGFEELFGRRLPIWAGGITLAVAGMLIVKYSIDSGLLSPLVRVLCGLLFGTALIAGAEAALRNQARVGDIRIRQALAGAGIASLYASVLVAARLYDLIGPVTAFVGLAGVTALAMGLALRFGAPAALLGLVGGLAAPALVGSASPNIPLLSTYLALAIGGLCTLSRNQRWAWLGISALAGGFGWGAILLVTGVLDSAASLSIGLYLLLLGIGLPLLLAPGKTTTLFRYAGAILAAGQMAALVASGGFTLLHWALFALISAAIVWLSRREPSFARLPAIGVGIALLLLGAWPNPALGIFVPVALAMAAIYGVPALIALWRPRGGLAEAAQIAAIALGGLAVAAFQFHRFEHAMDAPFAALALALAAFPAAAAALGWRNATRRDDARFALLATGTALLIGAATLFAVPAWSLATTTGMISAALLLLALVARDPVVERGAWPFLLAAIALLALGDQSFDEAHRLLGGDDRIPLAQALLRWTALALAAAFFAWRAGMARSRAVAQAAAALLGYGVVAQLIPATPLPVMPALGLVALAEAGRRLAPARLLPALATLFTLALFWSFPALVDWLSAAMLSLTGAPLLVTALPATTDILRELVLPAALIAAACYRAGARIDRPIRAVALAAAGLMAIVGGHSLFKHVLSLRTPSDFVALGLAERTLWEAILLGSAALVWRFADRRAGLAVATLALAHSLWYSLLLHNPLWTDQAVGALALANGLIVLYGLPLAALWVAGRFERDRSARLDRPRSIAQMMLVALLGVSLLRQLFAGSILTVHGVTSAEDIGRSMLAVALGVGFLLWGISRRSRDWRIGSLLLMLGAAAKVFLFDVAGLEGLLRIASFVALGFSLIGIGWLYSRFLSHDTPLTATAVAEKSEE